MYQIRRENTAVGRIVSQLWALIYWRLWQTIDKIIWDWTTIRSYREAVNYYKKEYEKYYKYLNYVYYNLPLDISLGDKSGLGVIWESIS